MKIAIVVLNYNGLGDTLGCLESLRRLKKDQNDLNFIVVDNGSTDGSVEALSQIRDIDLVTNNENLGYSGGNNVGIERALQKGADWILILNNDTIAEENLILNLLGTAENGSIISPKIYFAPGFEFHKKRYNKNQLGKVIWYAGGRIDWQNILGVHLGVNKVDIDHLRKEKEIDFATGACMLVKRGVIEKIGFFDEKYFLYLEDMDFCVRARNAGFKIIFEPQAILWHKNAAAAGGSGSRLQDYYISRNRLLFAFKYARLKTKFAVLRQMITQINNPIKKKALFDFLTLNFGKGDI